MPYAEMVCNECGNQALRYHNMRVCPKCKRGRMIAVSPWTHQGYACTREDNLALRREINYLRAQLGQPPKYETIDRPAATPPETAGQTAPPFPASGDGE